MRWLIVTALPLLLATAVYTNSDFSEPCSATDEIPVRVDIMTNAGQLEAFYVYSKDFINRLNENNVNDTEVKNFYEKHIEVNITLNAASLKLGYPRPFPYQHLVEKEMAFLLRNAPTDPQPHDRTKRGAGMGGGKKTLELGGFGRPNSPRIGRVLDDLLVLERDRVSIEDAQVEVKRIADEVLNGNLGARPKQRLEPIQEAPELEYERRQQALQSEVLYRLEAANQRLRKLASRTTSEPVSSQERYTTPQEARILGTDTRPLTTSERLGVQTFSENYATLFAFLRIGGGLVAAGLVFAMINEMIVEIKKAIYGTADEKLEATLEALAGLAAKNRANDEIVNKDLKKIETDSTAERIIVESRIDMVSLTAVGDNLLKQHDFKMLQIMEAKKGHISKTAVPRIFWNNIRTQESDVDPNWEPEMTGAPARYDASTDTVFIQIPVVCTPLTASRTTITNRPIFTGPGRQNLTESPMIYIDPKDSDKVDEAIQRAEDVKTEKGILASVFPTPEVTGGVAGLIAAIAFFIIAIKCWKGRNR